MQVPQPRKTALAERGSVLALVAAALADEAAGSSAPSGSLSARLLCGDVEIAPEDHRAIDPHDVKACERADVYE